MNQIPPHKQQTRSQRAMAVLGILICGWVSWASPLLVADLPACGMVCCLEGEGECCYEPGLELDATDSPISGRAIRESISAGCPPSYLLTAAPGSPNLRQGGLPDPLQLVLTATHRSGHSRPIGAAIDHLNSTSSPRAPPVDRSGYSTTA